MLRILISLAAGFEAETRAVWPDARTTTGPIPLGHRATLEHSVWLMKIARGLDCRAVVFTNPRASVLCICPSSITSSSHPLPFSGGARLKRG